MPMRMTIPRNIRILLGVPGSSLPPVTGELTKLSAGLSTCTNILAIASLPSFQMNSQYCERQGYLPEKRDLHKEY